MATSFGAEAISLAITHARNELGYRELRPKQELAVKTFLSGNDVFVSVPTGSSKTLCYCLLPKAFYFLHHTTEEASCIVIIVSPLIALMQDQVRAMRERTVSAVYAGKAEIN